jgi:hypothetical protein
MTKPFIKTRKGHFDWEQDVVVIGKGKTKQQFEHYLTADWKDPPADLMAQLNAFFKDNNVQLELIQVDEGSDQDTFVIKDMRSVVKPDRKKSTAVLVREIVESEISIYRHFNDKQKGSRRLKFVPAHDGPASKQVDMRIKQKLIAAGIGWISAGWYETLSYRGPHSSYVVRLPL